MKLSSLFIILITCSLPVFATIDAYEFENYEDEHRFRALVEELRCPKCQNQNIADSNAGLAKDIKDRTHKLVVEGKSNKEITDYMVERYGDFITYRPAVTPITWFLWFGPFVLALLAAAILLVRKLKSKPVAEANLAPEQQNRVDALMKKLDQIDR